MLESGQSSIGTMGADWKPARITSQAPHHGAEWTDYHVLDRGKVVRVRPAQLTPLLIVFMRCHGCDASEAYEIHPDDIAKLSDPELVAGTLICAHQIIVAD